jgi:hypothetical protein
MAESSSRPQGSELPADDKPRAESGAGERYEMHAQERPLEAAENAIYELPQPVYELPHTSHSRDGTLQFARNEKVA